MILLDIFVVALSNIPLGMFLIYVVAKVGNRRFTSVEILLVTLAQIISTIQIFGSFYFYLAVSSTFRNNVNSMLRNIICFWKPATTHQIAPSVQTAGVQPTVITAMVVNKVPDVVQ